MKRATRLDAIVTLVDAKNLPARLADSKEAVEQIAFADIVVLNKMDLVTEAEAAEVERRIRAINPYAEIRRSTKSDVPISAVIGREAFDLKRILEREPEFLSGEDHHEHDGDILSVSFEVTRPVDPESSMPGSPSCWPPRARTCCAPRASSTTPATIAASPSRRCT